MIHAVKCEWEFFDVLADGRKTNCLKQNNKNKGVNKEWVMTNML